MSQLAEVFPPGEFLKDELDARNWTQTEFAKIIGRPHRLVNEIIAGKKSITPETAVQLAQGLGTSPELWMNLESAYQLSKVSKADDTIQRKAAVHELFPVREMVKRRWIDDSENIGILEKQLLDFFDIQSFSDQPVLQHAAKKTSYESVSSMQLAWLFRAKQIAETQVLGTFGNARLAGALDELKSFLSAPEEIRHVPKVLNDAGVRYVVVEAFPGTKLDGACFWISKSKPVIAMSLRLDRIDNFWFVLRHEIEHVLRGDGKDGQPIVDEDTGSSNAENLKECEIAANNAASNFCVNWAELDNYIQRVNPYYFSDKKVRGFAFRIGVHPGVVVGQLHNRFKEYQYLRKHLVKVREIITQSASSDGWGTVFPV